MNEALNFVDSPAVLRHVRINAVDGERFGVVSAQGHRYWLKPALGCLLRPAVGDSVLVSLAGEEGYILSVLERSQPQASELRLSGDLLLKLPTGALAIEARDGVALDAGASLSVCADNAVGHFAKAQLGVSRLEVSGERVDQSWIERNESAVRHSEHAARHFAEYGDSRRQVNGHEQLHAGSVRQRVDKDWSLHAETLDLFAEVTIALDGERIKLG